MPSFTPSLPAKVAPEDKKDRRTKEVEAESVAYTVCQRYGIETSDYSFGYIAGWSSDKGDQGAERLAETIRKTAAEMITGIDEKLKERLAMKEQEAPYAAAGCGDSGLSGSCDVCL